MDISLRMLPPSRDFPLGTDQYGRDVYSRVLRGAWVAMSVGLVSVGLGLGLGLSVGVLSAYAGGPTAEILMRAMDGFYAFPVVLVAIMIVSALGPGHYQAMVAIGIANMPLFARLSRGSFLSIKERDFVEAARSLGGGDLYVILRHILPNGLSPLIVQSTSSFASAILAEASLSFLGLGTQPPQPSWGKMLEESRNFAQLAPWMAFSPGLAIAISVLGFNLLGDGLRDSLDPRFPVQERRP
jgi:peptide/nickel transport system permease protein